VMGGAPNDFITANRIMTMINQPGPKSTIRNPK